MQKFVKRFQNAFAITPPHCDGKLFQGERDLRGFSSYDKLFIKMAICAEEKKRGDGREEVEWKRRFEDTRRCEREKWCSEKF